MQKAKKYDWKDSNLALFGTDVEKNVKKSSAETEKAWQGSGAKVGLQIWRVVKFKITHWPKDDYGKFYDGDSYIILNTYKEKESDALLYDVHFWIGKHSSQDEYGTAAYKTVELDTFHDDKPIQHREVQNYESDLFKSYFPTIQIMKGGADTGFRHVAPKEYKPRLLHVFGERKRVKVVEVGLLKSNLNEKDVFILDLGLKIYQWNGRECNKDEKFKATQFLQQLKSERSGKPKVENLDSAEGGEILSYLKDGEKKQKEQVEDIPAIKTLHKLSDAGGDMSFSLAKEGHITKGDFDRNDVFILDTTKEVYVWVGSAASPAEQKNGMTYAHNYLMKTKYPFIPVTVIKEGQESKGFNVATAA